MRQYGSRPFGYAGIFALLAAFAISSAMLTGCGEKSPGTEQSKADTASESVADESAAKAAESAISELLNGSSAAEKAEESGKAAEAGETTTEDITEAAAESAQALEETAAGEKTEEKTAAGEVSDTAYYGPQPGELDPAIEGAYGSGRTVVFAGAAYLRQPDGIYLLAGHREPELLVALDPAGMAEICTDGYMLYYCDGGRVMALDLTAGNAAPVPVSDPGFAVPEGSGVVGVGHFTVYVETPGGITDDMYEGASDLSNVIAMSLKTGLPEETFEGCYGGCRGGYTFVRHDSFDVSPQRLRIFGFQGETVVDEPDSWGVQSSQGLLWYSMTDPDAGSPNAVLYKVDADGPEEILRCEEDTGDYYGIWVDGFLACIVYDPGETAGEAGQTGGSYIDLRTMEPAKVFTENENSLYWRSGCTVRGTDYLIGSDRIFAVGTDGIRDIFDLPADIYAGGVYLTEDHILVEDIENRTFVFDLDPDNMIHKIPVTSLVRKRREAGTEGLQVTEYCTELMSEGAWHWTGLYSVLNAWNTDAAARTEKLADECYELAEDLASYGMYDDLEDPDLKAQILAYIQRADTSAFTFMEHTSIDTVAGPRNYEIKTGYNFATEDGHALTLDEVFTDLNGLADLMIADLQANFPRAEESFSFYDFVDEMLSRRSLVSTPEFSWVLGYEGVSFYYNGSVNVPFVRGAWKFYVSFSEHPELFDEKWTAVPETYAYDILLDDYFAEDYQVESGKGIRTVLVTADRAQDADGLRLNYIDTLNIWVSDAPMGEMRTNEEQGMPVFSDTLSGMILHTKEGGGSNHLLVQSNGDSMGMEIYALDSRPKTTFSLGQGALPQYCPENGVDAVGKYVTHVWLSDPDFFTVLLLDEEDIMNGFTERTFCRFRNGRIEKY